jgi:glycosyltransferase involved in cell wall biosynthesis
MKPFSADTTCIAIMSYNRREYLLNCVESAERYLPGYSVTIFDDGSTDAASLRALDEIRPRHRVLDCRNVARGDRGGLHANMNTALEEADRRGLEYVWFIQDDMQFVRPIDVDLVENVNRIFSSDATVAQVDPSFFRGYWPDATLHARIVSKLDPPSYWPTFNAGWNQGLMDVGIVSLSRVNGVKFRFADSEMESRQLSESLGLRRVHPRDPIMCQTPWPAVVPRRIGTRASLKDRLRYRLIRLQEWVVDAGCHRILPWSSEKIDAFKSRPLNHYPVADRYLETADRLLSPWWYIACNDLSDFKHPLRLLRLHWLRFGQPTYRRQAAEKVAQDGADWVRTAGEPPRNA